MPVLTAIDVINIQSFITPSNRLRDVISASYLVTWATSCESKEGLDVPDAPQPEILMAAGGNAVLKFETLDLAKAFVLRYTRRLLELTPGLEIAVAHHQYTAGELSKSLLVLQVKLALAKLNRRPQAPQLGLSVMASCEVTGLPASEQHPRYGGQWISSHIASIRNNDTVDTAKKRWNRFLPDAERQHCGFPDEFDQMGRTYGDTSLIGVVHIDGNNIGKRIHQWFGKHIENSCDTTVIDEFRQWSPALNQLGEKILRAAVERIAGRIKQSDDGNWWVRGQPEDLDFELKTGVDGAILLPFRPVLMGGDDLTFVCDGRIALDLAVTALKVFEEESQGIEDLKPLGNGPLTACAGIALVKAHAPFSRSYELCKALCATAKQTKREAEGNGEQTGAWLDWHIGTPKPGESPRDIRIRQYSWNNSHLTCRPYPLDGNASHRLTWNWLDADLLGLSEHFEEKSNKSFRNPNIWGDRRNKIKALTSLVREGDKVVKKQLEAWKNLDHSIGLPEPLGETGFKGQYTPLLDAIELLDIHLRLNSPPDAIAKVDTAPKCEEVNT